jgi:hypothetical protein
MRRPIIWLWVRYIAHLLGIGGSVVLAGFALLLLSRM